MRHSGSEYRRDPGCANGVSGIRLTARQINVSERCDSVQALARIAMHDEPAKPNVESEISTTSRRSAGCGLASRNSRGDGSMIHAWTHSSRRPTWASAADQGSAPLRRSGVFDAALGRGLFGHLEDGFVHGDVGVHFVDGDFHRKAAVDKLR